MQGEHQAVFTFDLGCSHQALTVQISSQSITIDQSFTMPKMVSICSSDYKKQQKEPSALYLDINSKYSSANQVQQRWLGLNDIKLLKVFMNQFEANQSIVQLESGKRKLLESQSQHYDKLMLESVQQVCQQNGQNNNILVPIGHLYQASYYFAIRAAIKYLIQKKLQISEIKQILCVPVSFKQDCLAFLLKCYEAAYNLIFTNFKEIFGEELQNFEFQIPVFNEQMVQFVAEPECGANSGGIDEESLFLVIDGSSSSLRASVLAKEDGKATIFDEHFESRHGGIDIDNFVIGCFKELVGNNDVFQILLPQLQHSLRCKKENFLNGKDEILQIGEIANHLDEQFQLLVQLAEQNSKCDKQEYVQNIIGNIQQNLKTKQTINNEEFTCSQFFKVEFDMENVENVNIEQQSFQNFNLSNLSFSIKKECFEVGIRQLVDQIFGEEGDLRAQFEELQSSGCKCEEIQNQFIDKILLIGGLFENHSFYKIFSQKLKDIFQLSDDDIIKPNHPSLAVIHGAANFQNNEIRILSNTERNFCSQELDMTQSDGKKKRIRRNKCKTTKTSVVLTVEMNSQQSEQNQQMDMTNDTQIKNETNQQTKDEVAISKRKMKIKKEDEQEQLNVDLNQQTDINNAQNAIIQLEQHPYDVEQNNSNNQKEANQQICNNNENVAIIQQDVQQSHILESYVDDQKQECDKNEKEHNNCQKQDFDGETIFRNNQIVTSQKADCYYDSQEKQTRKEEDQYTGINLYQQDAENEQEINLQKGQQSNFNSDEQCLKQFEGLNQQRTTNNETTVINPIEEKNQNDKFMFQQQYQPKNLNQDNLIEVQIQIYNRDEDQRIKNQQQDCDDDSVSQGNQITAVQQEAQCYENKNDQQEKLSSNQDNNNELHNKDMIQSHAVNDNKGDIMNIETQELVQQTQAQIDQDPIINQYKRNQSQSIETQKHQDIEERKTIEHKTIQNVNDRQINTTSLNQLQLSSSQNENFNQQRTNKNMTVNFEEERNQCDQMNMIQLQTQPDCQTDNINKKYIIEAQEQKHNKDEDQRMQIQQQDFDDEVVSGSNKIEDVLEAQYNESKNSEPEVQLSNKQDFADNKDKIQSQLVNNSQNDIYCETKKQLLFDKAQTEEGKQQIINQCQICQSQSNEAQKQQDSEVCKTTKCETQQDVKDNPINEFSTKIKSPKQYSNSPRQIQSELVQSQMVLTSARNQENQYINNGINNEQEVKQKKKGLFGCCK